MLRGLGGARGALRRRLMDSGCGRCYGHNGARRCGVRLVSESARSAVVQVVRRQRRICRRFAAPGSVVSRRFRRVEKSGPCATRVPSVRSIGRRVLIVFTSRASRGGRLSIKSFVAVVLHRIRKCAGVQRWIGCLAIFRSAAPRSRRFPCTRTPIVLLLQSIRLVQSFCWQQGCTFSGARLGRCGNSRKAYRWRPCNDSPRVGISFWRHIRHQAPRW